MIPAGAHSARVAAVRALASGRGRREQGRFAFEGPTLMAEAQAAGIVPLEVYATPQAFAATPTLAQFEAAGSAIFSVDARTLRKISTLETPSGIVAVTPTRFAPLAAVATGGLVLVLADIADPGNAGTLLRSAEAFGARAVIFGDRGVDPYHPKVVRAAMGALFRLPIAVATPGELLATGVAGRTVGLDAGGDALTQEAFGDDCLLVVGNESHGLGRWEALCSRRVAIPMQRATESLNAGVAGSIALFAASRMTANMRSLSAPEGASETLVKRVSRD